MLWAIDDDDYDYEPTYEDHTRVDSTYIHVVPTKEHLYFDRLADLQTLLNQRVSELDRFAKYLTEAETEVNNWKNHISRKTAEISEVKEWISSLVKEFGTQK